MKTKIKSGTTIGLMAFLLTFFSHAIVAQPADYSKLAENIINKAIQVKPGDVVIISGNKAFLDLMEQLAIKVDLAGGTVTMDVYSDIVSYNYWNSVPLEYMKRNRNPRLVLVFKDGKWVL